VQRRAKRSVFIETEGSSLLLTLVSPQDDIIDDVESFVAAAEILKERGAYKIYVMATHGILSAEAPRLIEESSIDEVVVTNTVPHEVQKLQCPKIKTVDISLILSEAIRRIHNGESMAYLFRNITVDD